MGKASPKLTLAANLQRLMEGTPSLQSQAKVAAKAKVDQKTVSRVLNASHAVTLDVLAALASAWDLEPWQLLAPKLGGELYYIDEQRRLVAVDVKVAQRPLEPERHFQPPPLPGAEPEPPAQAAQTPSRRSGAGTKPRAKAEPR